MVDIRPFKAIRYTEHAGDPATLITQPYDKIDSAMQKDIDVKFRKYYTVSKANYMVEDMYLQKPVEIVTEGVF